MAEPFGDCASPYRNGFEEAKVIGCAQQHHPIQFSPTGGEWEEERACNLRLWACVIARLGVQVEFENSNAPLREGACTPVWWRYGQAKMIAMRRKMTWWHIINKNSTLLQKSFPLFIVGLTSVKSQPNRKAYFAGWVSAYRHLYLNLMCQEELMRFVSNSRQGRCHIGAWIPYWTENGLWSWLFRCDIQFLDLLLGKINAVDIVESWDV